MSVAEFVSNLRKLAVRLSADGERLLVNAPKGVLTDSLRSEIAKRKEELLEFLSENEQPAAFTPAPILRRTAGSPAPLSFAQERLWFLEQLEPGSPAYNICRASRLTGQLNIAALEASLTEILRRHEILRSQIHIVDGRPTQITIFPLEVKFHFSDLRSLPRTEWDAEVRRQIRAEEKWQFDFSAGLFLRAVLIQVNDDQHILVLTTHHIVSDAWSMGILTGELWTLYDSYAKGRPVSLPELLVQYADYALWQREWLQGDVLEFQLSYWKEQLKELPILNFPTDHPRSVKQSFRGGRQPLSLSDSLTAAVNELSGGEGVTQFMTLLAVFQVLLYRYSGQEDIAVGSPIANRSRTEIEELIGFFVNTLVLRSDLSGNPSFRELLLRVRDVCLQAYAHQDLPFEKLVEELRPERDLSRNPLFQVMFVLQNTPRPLPQPAGLSIERVDVLPATSPFDLSLYLRERDGKLIGFFEYNTDLFESSTIERMIGHFETLLEGIIADPEQPISTLPLLTEAERHQLLVEWNDTHAEYPKNKCIHQLFEAQVERTPKSIAIEFEGKQLTYRELNKRANQLAHYLRGLGVGPEKLVGIYMERSLEMVVALLGILKAGGAYVPLDPEYPKKRLRFMLEDAQVSIVMTELSDRVRNSLLNTHPNLVCLDRDWRFITQLSGENLNIDVRAENLAYVIYTSGSTGQPKGVLVEHSSLINCLVSINRQIEICTTDKFLAVTTISFDIAALELFLPLIVGARIIVASKHDVTDGDRLKKKLMSSKATAMQATPSMWKLLVNAKWKGKKKFKIISGGEAFSRALVNQMIGWSSLIWNAYGPTETTIWSTINQIKLGDESVSIGRPICNTQLYVLDAHLQPVPIGVHGELYIGGSGVARGYLNRPELTTERFTVNGVSHNYEDRRYRTGDLAKYLPNGNIELLGRVDNQVKIRGYRVELGEIEAALARHPLLREGIVVAREREPLRDREVVAYIVPNHSNTLRIDELRSFLGETLPGYMVPSVFVSLESLPVMPTGKVDRNALPPPDGRRPEMGHGLVEPRTEFEELIADIWKTVLKIEEVGVYDDFFDLGGHSLLAAQMVARTQEVFNKNISIREFFEARTISAMAELIANRKISQRQANLPPIVRVTRGKAFPLSLSQRQVWVLDQLLPGTLFLNMPYSFRLIGRLDLEALKRSIQETVTRHEAFQMLFKEQKGRPVQIVGEIPTVQMPVEDLRHLAAVDAEKEYTRLSTDDAELPFDLETGPPFRIKLIRFADNDHALLVTVHHIVCDHWSMQVFRRELIALYEAYANGRPSPLAEVPIHLVDFVSWQQELFRRHLLEIQLDYWKKQLAGRRPMMEFRNEGKKPKQFGFGIASQTIEIDQGVFGAIKICARREGCSIFMMLIAVISIMLYGLTGQSDIRIGATVANRGRRETDGLVGNCLNVVVLRVEISPVQTFLQLLRQIRATTLDALTHQELPFGKLATALAKTTAGEKATPLFQVMLMYQNRAFEPVQRSGLTFASWDGKYRRRDVGIALTPVEMIFDFRELSTTLTGSVNYKAQSFHDSDVTTMIDGFHKLIQWLRCDSDEKISSLLN